MDEDEAQTISFWEKIVGTKWSWENLIRQGMDRVSTKPSIKYALGPWNMVGERCTKDKIPMAWHATYFEVYR